MVRKRWVGLLRCGVFTTLCAACFLAPCAMADTVIVDNMDAPNYFSFSFNNASGGGNPNDDSFVSFSTLGSGGNPGSSLRVEHVHQLFDDLAQPDVSLQSFFLNQANFYNPIGSGAIAELEFSLDYTLESAGAETDIFSVFFVVNDSLGGNAAGFLNITPDGSWQTATVSGLTNSNFSSRDFAGPLDLNFGFGFTSSGELTASDSIVLRVDNFRVSVTTVPEPTGACLLIGMTAGLVMRRRRVVCV